ncbi:MAG TPA: L-rhamnose/proton symporter RhaT [Chitinophagaceae bacterium]|nr:L-rhamnose/proton symporter RhaT [Chitinophagaceae bacterium]
MITPSPIEGVGLHAVGATSASTCYLPFHKTKKWSWISYWLVQALFAWIVAPLVIAVVTVPDFFNIIAQAPPRILLITFLLGDVMDLEDCHLVLRPDTSGIP